MKKKKNENDIIKITPIMWLCILIHFNKFFLHTVYEILNFSELSKYNFKSY